MDVGDASIVTTKEQHTEKITYIVSGHMILPHLYGQHSQLLMMRVKLFAQERQQVVYTLNMHI